MNIGMLWFDNDSQADLAAKIHRAAAYYEKKYGKRANLCFIHPSMAPARQVSENEQIVKAGNVEIRTTRAVLPNHIWIGVKQVKQ